MPDWLEVTPDDLSVDRYFAFVADPAAGGVGIFIGTTRAETDSAGRALVALDYEAYREMAIEQLRILAAEARQRWPIVKLAIVHRVGRVELAEPSVVVAVSTPHRAQALEACRWLIDSLKKQATIWKKEVWADGSASWSKSASPGPGAI